MPIETRPFGPDATPVLLLGFGCGAVGGLMEFGRIAAAVTASLAGSLRRLQRDQVNIFHRHNA